MVRVDPGLGDVPHPDDAADALAVAICHVQIAPFRSVLVHKPATGWLAGARDRQRLDEALVERGLAENRSRARALIMAADVLVNGLPSLELEPASAAGDEFSLKAPPRFVSRGGEKLAHALDVFGIGRA